MRPTVLVVEDDPAMQGVWQTIFGRRGWEVSLASTVREGLALLEPAPLCLILDLRLPDGGGETILRQVREAKLATRVVVTTASDEADQLGIVEALAPEALLHKPVDVLAVWNEGLAASSSRLA